MKYRLFFCYQSDTENEKEFILKALGLVKEILLNSMIELDVKSGTWSTSGQGDLLHAVIEGASQCDIFLADVTFVAKFDNTSKTPKYVPNPNVMFETGHAWHALGSSQILFTQNAAYWGTENLPVDLKGLIYPIRYNGHTESEKTNFANNLCDRIRGIITSINRNNECKFFPFEKFSSWSNRLSDAYTFISTKYFTDISDKILDKLNGRHNITISGTSGSGKSRLVHQVISSGYDAEYINNVYYCKTSLTSPTDLYKKLRELESDLQRPSIFIINGCDELIMNAIKDEILKDSNHVCIFIIEANRGKDIHIDQKKYCAELISAKQLLNTREFLYSPGYDLKRLIPALYEHPYDTGKYKGLTENEERIINYLSLFSKIGFEDRFEIEFASFCSIFNINLAASPVDTVRGLIAKGYVISVGGFIYIEADSVAEEYCKSAWEEGYINEGILREVIASPMNRWFINRQVRIQSTSKECKQFLKSHVKKELRTIEVLDSNYGGHAISELAKLFPNEVLSTLEFVYSRNPDYVYLQSNMLRWAIKDVLTNETLFYRAIKLLMEIKGEEYTYSHSDPDQDVIDAFCPRYSTPEDKNHFDSLVKLFNDGKNDLFFKICSKLLDVNINELNDNDKTYRKNIILFIIEKRDSHKEQINEMLVKHIILARNLGLANTINPVIRTIISDDDPDDKLFIKLEQLKKWASGSDKEALRKLNKSICDINPRQRLYAKIMEVEWGRKFDDQESVSMINSVAEEVIRSQPNWVIYADLLMRQGQDWKPEIFYFGRSIGGMISDLDSVITTCLEFYKKIPLEKQSYGLVIGLMQNIIIDEDFSAFKLKRNEMLKDSALVYCALDVSNYCPTNIEDFKDIKDAIVRYSLPLKHLAEIWRLKLDQSEYVEIISELIATCKEGSDTGLILLKRAVELYPELNHTKLLSTVIRNYNYWDFSEVDEDSAYKIFIKLQKLVIRKYPSNDFAELVIKSLIENCDKANFNDNLSVVRLFRLLIDNYQDLVMTNIAPLLNAITNYSKLRQLQDLLRFENNADENKYLEWVISNGVKAAQFAAYFIRLHIYSDHKITAWTLNSLELMSRYADSHVMNIISTRLFNGSISISRYMGLKSGYELLVNHENIKIRLWAISQAEYMEVLIQNANKDNVLDTVIWK